MINERIEYDGLLDRIFETNPTALIVLTPSGEITRCNQRGIDLLQLSESEIEERTYTEPEWTFFDGNGEPISADMHPFNVVRENRGPIFNRVYQLSRPHAPTIDISISGAPIMDDDGAVQRLVFSFEDITKQRERERQLNLKNEQLEVLNRVVRHDIRNDMGVVMGWLEMLDEEVESTEGQKAAERVMEASRHVVEITETVRDLMDLVTGDGSITAEPTELKPLLRSSIDIVADSYPDAELTVDDELPDIRVNGSKLLNSVFENILRNAIQHNDKDQPVVVITAQRKDEVVQVSIADNGPGIPDEQKESIFGKSEKGLESSGTGIGLYLVKSLVDAFDGTVWVEDNEPGGALFIVELPVTKFPSDPP